MVLRRLFRSPRLIVLIATIGVAQLVIVARLVLPKPGTAPGDRVLAGGARLFPVPFHFAPVEFGRVVLQPQHFLVLIAGPLLALALFAFLRWSAYGIALRAAAENAPRARLLGIPVRRVSTLAWVLAAVLSGAAAILLAPVIGFSSTEAVGLPLLMRGLAAATITGMTSVGAAFGAGLAIGVADQLVYFWLGRAGLTDVVLLVVIVIALLWRRQEFRRTTLAEESSWDAVEPVRPLAPEIAAHPRWRTTVCGRPRWGGDDRRRAAVRDEVGAHVLRGVGGTGRRRRAFGHRAHRLGRAAVDRPMGTGGRGRRAGFEAGRRLRRAVLDRARAGRVCWAVSSP